MVESFVLNFKVQAFWDKDAEVWVVTSDDVPGLATEASTIEAINAKTARNDSRTHPSQ